MLKYDVINMLLYIDEFWIFFIDEDIYLFGFFFVRVVENRRSEFLVFYFLFMFVYGGYFVFFFDFLFESFYLIFGFYR